MELRIALKVPHAYASGAGSDSLSGEGKAMTVCD
jgi:hypothetical protein